MRIRAAAAALLTLGLAALIHAPSAQAHAALVASDPADGTTLSTLPDRVSLTFDEAVDEPAFVSVTSPDGTVVVSGEASVFDATVSQPLPERAAQGTYTIAFRVTSLDGHPVTGTIEFHVGHASDPTGAVAIPGPEDAGGNSFISEHVASLTIAMAAITLAICLAILKAARGRQQAVESKPTEPTQGDV